MDETRALSGISFLMAVLAVIVTLSLAFAPPSTKSSYAAGRGNGRLSMVALVDTEPASLLSLDNSKHQETRASKGSEQTFGAFVGSIVRSGNDPVLKSKAVDVTEDDLLCRYEFDRDMSDDNSLLKGRCGSRAEAWVDLMLTGLRETNGAAIAAPQVGISKRIVVMSIARERIKEEMGNTTVMAPVVLVNPVLTPVNQDDTEEVWETCLSVPGEQVIAKRYKTIHYRAQRLDGEVVEGLAYGRLALTLQHEVDHLDGVLMTDIAIEEPQGTPRTDGLGAVLSTDHWDMMDDPEYNIRTAMCTGASVVSKFNSVIG